MQVPALAPPSAPDDRVCENVSVLYLRMHAMHARVDRSIQKADRQNYPEHTCAYTYAQVHTYIDIDIDTDKTMQGLDQSGQSSVDIQGAHTPA